MKKKFRITYNAPVTLTFAILCVVILLMNDFLLGKHLIPALFTAPARIGTKILLENQKTSASITRVRSIISAFFFTFSVTLIGITCSEISRLSCSSVRSWKNATARRWCSSCSWSQLL